MFVNLNANGTVYKTVGDRVFRKSNNANVIALFAPFSKDINIYINFKLPNNTIYSGTMTFKEFAEAEQKNLWMYSVQNNITEYAGTVEVSFEIHTVKPDEILTTAKVNITVEECLDNNIVVSQPDQFLVAINQAQATADSAVAENDTQNTTITGIQSDITNIQTKNTQQDTALTNHINAQTLKEADQDAAILDRIQTVGYTNVGNVPKITYSKNGVTTEVNVTGFVCDITLNEADGVLTVTKAGGGTTTLDINIESGVAAVGSTYDSATKTLKIRLLNGTDVSVSLADIYAPINTLTERVNAQEVINNENVTKIATIEGNYLKNDGTVQMVATYSPTQAKQLADKAYVDSAILGVTGVDMSTYVTQTQLANAVDNPSYVTETFNLAVNNPANAVRLAPQELTSYEGNTQEVGGLLKSVVNPKTKIVGKNLADNSTNANIEINANTGAETSATNTVTTGYIRIDTTKTYKSVVTYNGTAVSITHRYYDINKVFIYTADTFDIATRPASAYYVRLRYQNIGAPLVPSLTKFMLNPGTTALTYEPYSECYTQLNETFRKAGTAVDKAVRKNGLWYKQNNIKEIVLNGTENFVHYATYTNCARFGYDNIADIKINGAITSNKFPEGVAGVDSENIDSHGSVKSIQITILKTKLAGWLDTWDNTQKVTAFKTWLASNNTTVAYETTTMTETQITYTTNTEGTCAFEQYSTIYLTSDTGILPTLKYNCAADVPSQVSLLSKDSQAQAQKLDYIMDTIGGTDGNSLDSRLDTLETNTADLPTIRNDIDTLQNDSSTATSNINSLDTRLGTAETNITTLQNNVGTLQTTVGSHTTNISNLQTSVGQNTDDITTLQNKVPSTIFYNGVGIRVYNTTNFESTFVATVATITNFADYEYLMIEFYPDGEDKLNVKLIGILPIAQSLDLPLVGQWRTGLSLKTASCMFRFVVANSTDLTLKAYKAAYGHITFPAGSGTITGGAFSETYSNLYITRVIGVKK